ncbi:PLP-dependent aminotransferase family protein [Staphylococcus felis]|uniref:PLP-dependent aminotransferase family protein n=1 Tax=Staphylococcus felis TaxID=46127 RepID=A0ABS0QRK4_9STAP|nr:PLP-dependent aminotransferase family protein [Staphylococcus felis]MBH9581807.1 PLP-dependent aminotransferase family protein [Staphylococcus felis]REI04720.1 PLP-dependent aminotransferase family protein [Staphylococcus felis]REI19723.1 PLP-dependent aminotransferase family protein [Staphylococcus felis]
MEMLMFNIQKSNHQPIYIQLYEKIKEHIINGTIHEGEKLPSKRQLSHYLSMSQTTIENAYALLIDEGFIFSKPKSGYYVSDIESLPFVLSKPDDSKSVSPLESQQERTPRYRFQLGAIDKSHFPFEQFRKYAKESFEDLQYDLVETGHIQGDYRLRFQINQYLFHSRGVQSTPDQIVIASSTEQLLSIITDILPKRHQFILEDPIYRQVRQLLKRKHITYDFLPVCGDGIDIQNIDALKQNILYITPSHQFPTGATMKLKKRVQLLKWASQDLRRFIIEDDYDSEFRYEGKPIPALQNLDQTGSVIYISTFSKSISPTIRIAYAVLPESLIVRYRQKTNIEGGTVPRHTQYMVSRFMETDQFERHLNRMRKIYRQKRDILLAQLQAHPDLFQISGEQTGMHFVIQIVNGLTESECISRFKQFDIQIRPISDYLFKYHYQQSPAFVLGFGGIPLEQLENHAQQLVRSLQ